MTSRNLAEALRALIESDLTALQERDTVSDALAESSVELYARAVLAYRHGEVERLRALAGQMEALVAKDEDHRAAWILAKARIPIRLRKIDLATLEDLFELARKSGLWKGEACFVAGLALEAADDHEASRRYYQEASKAFQKQGCPKKSLKSLLNAVAADSRAHMEKKLLNDYHFIYRKAEALGEASIAGIALVNLSREYQKLGARVVALKWVNRAIETLESEFGSIQYELALAHRCHLLFEMERALEAEADYQAIRASNFPEVKAALAVIDGLRARSATSKAPVPPRKDLLPTWKERRGEQKPSKLTELEQKLLACLADGPKNKFDIIEALYGDRLAPDAAENRFNNLLSRIRKKLPGVVVLQDGKYEIVDEASKLT